MQHVAFSPPLDFFRHILLAHLSKMNVHARVNSFAKGFYPVGRGRLSVTVDPQLSRILPIRCVDQGEITGIQAVIWGTGLGDQTEHIMQMLKESVRNQLEAFAPYGVSVRVWEDPVEFDDCKNSECVGKDASAAPYGQRKRNGRGAGRLKDSKRTKYQMIGCQVWCETTTGSMPCVNDSMETGGSNKDKMVDAIDFNLLARRVTSRLCAQVFSGAAMDEHTADQLLIFMAAAAVSAETVDAGKSSILCEPYDAKYSSRHIETAIAVIEKMYTCACVTGRSSTNCRFTMTEVANSCRLIECVPIFLSSDPT